MTRIIGLDLSCASTGVALPTGRTLTLKPHWNMRGGPRLSWISGSIAKIVRVYEPQLAVIEDYAPNSIGPISTIRLAEVGGAVRCQLYEMGVPYVEVNNKTLKLWATGRGGATKDEMLSEALARGAPAANYDEADAALLRFLALAALDTAEPHELLLGMTWPRLG